MKASNFVIIVSFLKYIFNCSATTIIAAKCCNGIVIAADTLSANSALIGNRLSRKLFLLTPSTVVCCADGSSDFRSLYKQLRETVDVHESLYEEKLSTTSITRIARQLIHQRYRNAHIVIAGFDKVSNKALSKSSTTKSTPKREYVLCEILPSGTAIHQNLITAGSGATLISSLLEETLCGTNNNAEKDSLKEFTTSQGIGRVRRALTLASKLDPKTGGDSYDIWTLGE